MSPVVTWQDIILRIAAAVLAGAVIGYDRGTRGHIAGLRTTILMCLAATGAMIEANLTLSVVGKTPQSFTTMDALRFPLGILSGIGFIGAGAIVRRGSLVMGVTTAATIWLMTVVGLILGAGYFLLGGILTAIAFVVLSVLKRLDLTLRREHHGQLTVEVANDGPSDEQLRSAIEGSGLKPTSLALDCGQNRRLRFRVTWYDRLAPVQTPSAARELAKLSGVTRVVWRPFEAGGFQD